MAQVQGAKQQPAWVASTAVTVRIRNRPTRSHKPSSAKSSRHGPTVGLNMTFDSSVDTMSPEKLALVVDVAEKHQILETHYGLAQSARVSTQILARRKAMLVDTVLVCILGILFVVVWSFVKAWPHLHAPWATNRLDAE
ncbi:hypothetical protein PG990_008779 [Apiospora arundinis]